MSLYGFSIVFGQVLFTCIIYLYCRLVVFHCAFFFFFNYYLITFQKAFACLLNVGCDHWFSGSTKWRFSLAFAGIPALIQLIGFLFGLPESPKWLASMGRKEEAARILQTLRHNPTEEQVCVPRDTVISIYIYIVICSDLIDFDCDEIDC